MPVLRFEAPAIGVDLMKLCASYHCKNDFLDEIRYSVSLLNNAILYAQDNPERIIIIEILNLAQSNISTKRLQEFAAELPNLVYDCYSMEDYVFLHKQNFQHIMYHYPITTYNELWAILQLSPYGVLIGEPLTFELPTVRKILDQNNTYVQLRVVPHIGRPTAWAHLRDQDNGIKHFWITPQMLHIYEPYVDVLELYDAKVERENALVNIYHKGDYVFGLNSLLRNCESEILCPMITEEISKKRINCGQHCMRLPSNCHYCDRIEAIIHLSKPNHS